MKLTLRSIKLHLNFPFSLGLLLSILSIAHLPGRFQVGAFDRNAAPQFILLGCIGIWVAVYMGWQRRLALEKSVAICLAALVTFSFISLLLSDSFTTSLIGDTGRYAGFASLLSLILIALAASQISAHHFRDALLGTSVGILLVTLLGLLQVLNLVGLPTGGGAGSTLGNLDFLSAWIGTTFLIVFLVAREFELPRFVIVIYFAISLFILWKINAKQGFLDLLIMVIFIGLFWVYHRSGISGISTMGWKAITTFLFLIWSEAIFLIPMAKLPFPGVSTDPQVSIRSDFWFSAAQMFIHHIGFGVGPDNYGNYYEKFRSLNSVKSTEFVLANDAHSSMLQTFATLGIFATLTFLVLILLVLFAAIDLYKATSNRRYLFLLLAFLVFYTNALISPITLPNKAIFWMLGGYLVGERFRLKVSDGLATVRLRTVIPAFMSASVLVYSLAIFTPAFFSINSALAANHAGKKVDYQASDSRPCIVYTNAQLNLVLKAGGDVPLAARKILRNHPRCLDALAFLAQDALHKKDYQTAGPIIYQLLDVAPARQSVVRVAAIYAMGAGDEKLKNLLTSQGLKLGILTESQLK